MSEYRIIQNALGFIPQRHVWLIGWDSLDTGGAWFARALACETLEEAREAIDKDKERRRTSKDWHTGMVIEYR